MTIIHDEGDVERTGDGHPQGADDRMWRWDANRYDGCPSWCGGDEHGRHVDPVDLADDELTPHDSATIRLPGGLALWLQARRFRDGQVTRDEYERREALARPVVVLAGGCDEEIATLPAEALRSIAAGLTRLADAVEHDEFDRHEREGNRR